MNTERMMVGVPMNPTRILKLAKCQRKIKDDAVAFLLAEGLKNLPARNGAFLAEGLKNLAR